MKLAVIFAIIQMSIGIFLKGMNSLHFRNRLDFFFEFIPQFLLLFALFGWMDILIIAKWMEKKNIENITLDACPTDKALFDQYNEVHLSPSIISTMIDIFLNGASNKYTGDKQKCELVELNYNYVVSGQ
jgi:vacuolar-type H+-ATPase subunit I/STV1